MARILVIDDEANIRMMLRIALEHVGHTVETAADGLEGLNKFGDGADWDLILLDQRMPGMEGLEVLREMRQRAPKTRIVMITAFGTVDLAAEAMQAGATDFLRKPFTIDILRNAVQAALDGVPATLAGREVSPVPISFDLTTVNGYRIHSSPGLSAEREGTLQDVFTVCSASGETQDCTVTLPAYLVELVKAHTDREYLPGGDCFWQALCGQALANYLWQHAELPPGNVLGVEDLTSGLRHWIDAALTAGA